MIKKYNDYKCLAPFRRRQCHCCCYPAYQSCWLIIPLWWHQFYGLWNASQCFHNAIQLGYSIHHWAGESLLIGWRADCHSPAEEGHGFWRSGHSDYGKRNGGCEGALCRGPHRDTKLHTTSKAFLNQNIEDYMLFFHNDWRDVIRNQVEFWSLIVWPSLSLWLLYVWHIFNSITTALKIKWHVLWSSILTFFPRFPP